MPDEKPFPFPFREDFKEYVVGQTPKFFSDYKGTFETVQDSEEGMCLTQAVSHEGICWDGNLHVPACTVFGDGAWANYALSADVKIVGGQVELGARSGTGEMKDLAYRWVLTRTGTWQLMYERTVLVTGAIDKFDPAGWHRLKLICKGTHLEGWVDGAKVTEQEHAKRGRGLASVGSSYDPNLFANIAVDPVR